MDLGKEWWEMGLAMAGYEKELYRLSRALQTVTRALDSILGERFEQKSDMILFMCSKDTPGAMWRMPCMGSKGASREIMQ